jgi:6-phosphogluconolactonase
VSATPAAKPTVEVYPDAETLANAAAALVSRSARASVDERGAFTLVLSGGSTPRRTYELLADTFSRFVPWDRTHVFFSDERVVPASDPRNNYAMARDALLSRVPIPPSHVHPMPTEGAVPSELAARYESGLRSHFASASRHRAEPICDLAVMGVGADGHTASLFPGAAELSEPERWVLAARAPEGTVVRDRLTLTLPVLNRTRRVVFLVNGAEKSDALARVLRPESGDVEAPPPAALVHGLHSTEWLIDSEVAAGMRD